MTGHLLADDKTEILGQYLYKEFSRMMTRRCLDCHARYFSTFRLFLATMIIFGAPCHRRARVSHRLHALGRRARGRFCGRRIAFNVPTGFLMRQQQCH